MNMDSIENPDIVNEELKFWKTIHRSLEDGDGEYAYADAGDSMSLVDEMLGGNQEYQRLTALRQEVSRKIMMGSAEEKREGIREFGDWISQVEAILDNPET